MILPAAALNLPLWENICLLLSCSTFHSLEYIITHLMDWKNVFLCPDPLLFFTLWYLTVCDLYSHVQCFMAATILYYTLKSQSSLTMFTANGGRGKRRTDLHPLNLCCGLKQRGSGASQDGDVWGEVQPQEFSHPAFTCSGVSLISTSCQVVIMPLERD